MSAPDPKEWAMTEAEIESVQYDADVYGVDSDEVQAPILAVARRRAIAELKALLNGAIETQGCLTWYKAIYGPDVERRIAAIEAESA